jgi:hypothetical protein
MKDFSGLNAIHQVLIDTDAHTEEARTFRPARATESGVGMQFISSVGQGSEHVVMVFEPAADRPRLYPAELPFVPNAEVWVTVSRGGSSWPGARWPCSLEAGRVIVASIVTQSVSDNWEPTVEPHERLIGSAILQTRLQRGQMIRLVTIAPAGQQWIVQLVHSGEISPD